MEEKIFRPSSLPRNWLQASSGCGIPAGGKYVFYSDITKDSPAFKVDEFEIVPSLFGFLPQAARPLLRGMDQHGFQ